MWLPDSRENSTWLDKFKPLLISRSEWEKKKKESKDSQTFSIHGILSVSVIFFMVPLNQNKCLIIFPHFLAIRSHQNPTP